MRRDIRSSIGTSSGVADGVELVVDFTIVDAANGCVPLPGAAMYIWHCDRDGQYSMYSQNAIDENYLRGVQQADNTGRLSFVTTFPGDYAGRWPHIHFEVYPDIETALTGRGYLAISQLALPKEICDTVYATNGYAQSTANLAGVSLASDTVFADDGGVHQLATITGGVGKSLMASLVVPV